jgi:hypothetical protein
LPRQTVGREPWLLTPSSTVRCRVKSVPAQVELRLCAQRADTEVRAPAMRLLHPSHVCLLADAQWRQVGKPIPRRDTEVRALAMFGLDPQNYGHSE